MKCKVKGEIYTLHEIKRRETNWVGRILRTNCLVNHVSGRKDGGKDRSEGKTRKTTSPAIVRHSKTLISSFWKER
jgi:hypothetical protein